MRCYEYILIDLGADLDVVPRACGPAPRPETVLLSLVTQHQKVVPIPASGVVAHDSRLALHNVVRHSHVEDAVVDSLLRQAGLSPQLWRPLVAFVAVCARVLFPADWVPDLDKLGTVAQL